MQTSLQNYDNIQPWTVADRQKIETLVEQCQHFDSAIDKLSVQLVVNPWAIYANDMEVTMTLLPLFDSYYEKAMKLDVKARNFAYYMEPFVNDKTLKQCLFFWAFVGFLTIISSIVLQRFDLLPKSLLCSAVAILVTLLSHWSVTQYIHILYLDALRSYRVCKVIAQFSVDRDSNTFCRSKEFQNVIDRIREIGYC